MSHFYYCYYCKANVIKNRVTLFKSAEPTNVYLKKTMSAQMYFCLDCFYSNCDYRFTKLDYDNHPASGCLYCWHVVNDLDDCYWFEKSGDVMCMWPSIHEKCFRENVGLDCPHPGASPMFTAMQNMANNLMNGNYSGLPSPNSLIVHPDQMEQLKKMLSEEEEK